MSYFGVFLTVPGSPRHPFHTHLYIFCRPRLTAASVPWLCRSCGVAVVPGQVRDAKCLHAHVADALMRGRGANAIGRATLELLEARGVPVDGGDRCSEQCNYGQEETAESWR